MSNVFSFTGTIGSDAVVRYTPAGLAVLNVSVANNTGYGDKQKTMWLRVALWGKRAESQIVDYLKKGQQVFVSGELSQSEYTAQDGSIKITNEVNATILDLVGKRSDTGQAKPPHAQTRRNQQSNAPPPSPPSDNGQSYDDFDDDIPF